MKNKLILTGIAAMIFFFAGCNKENDGSERANINADKVKISNDYELSRAFNDTLKTVYNSVQSPINNPVCLMYDSLYHHSDSLFNAHYGLFCDEMYRNNIMMPYYTPSSAMMQGGMMGSGMMNINDLRGDTTEVNGYYRNMHNLRTDHQIYHNGIFN